MPVLSDKPGQGTPEPEETHPQAEPVSPQPEPREEPKDIASISPPPLAEDVPEPEETPTAEAVEDKTVIPERKAYLERLTERLPAMTKHQLIFVYQDILYKSHHVKEAGKALQTRQAEASAEERDDVTRVVNRNVRIAENLMEEAGLIIAEMKNRKMDHTKITMEPEKDCDFLQTCLKKINAINKGAPTQTLLPCYYCEFNSVKHPRPNPMNRFIVIDREDVGRHFEQLKVPMKLKKFRSVLTSMNVLEKNKYFVLNMSDPLCNETVMEHLDKIVRIQRQQAGQRTIMEAVREQVHGKKDTGVAAGGTAGKPGGPAVSGPPDAEPEKGVGEAGAEVQPEREPAPDGREDTPAGDTRPGEPEGPAEEAQSTEAGPQGGPEVERTNPNPQPGKVASLRMVDEGGA